MGNPFDCIKTHAPHLSTKENISRQEATDLALKEFEGLHKELEGFKKKVIPGYKLKEFVSPDKSEAIKKITDEYQSKIEEERNKPVEPKPTEEKIGVDETPDQNQQGAGTPPPEPPKAEPIEGKGDGLSGIKKALVSDEVVKGVDFEKVGDNEMMAMGKNILDSGEVNPELLVQKIVTEKKGVLTPAEVVGLIYYKTQLDNNLRNAYTEYNRKKEKGEDVGTSGVEIADLERQKQDYEVMSVITAQQQSLSFRLRKKMLDKNFNVVEEIEKYKKVNKGHIPPEVEKKFREIEKKLKEANDKISEYEKKKSDAEGQEAVDNIKESVDRDKKYTDEELEKKVQEGVDTEINKIFEQLPSEKKRAGDKAIAALQKFREKLKGRTYESTLGIPVAIADLGAVTAIRAIKVGRTIAEAVEMGVNRIKKALKEKGIDKWDKEADYWKDLSETLEGEGVSLKQVKDKPIINENGTVTIPNLMIRNLVERGITDINDLAKEVHKEVAKDVPDITERQVRDYITEYGKKANPTADKIQQQVNTAKRIGRLLSEVEDLQNKKVKEKNPSAAAKLTEKERELKRQIRALEKDMGIEGKSMTDEQKIENAKIIVKDRIVELKRQLKNKYFTKNKKTQQPSDNELENLNIEKEKLLEEIELEQEKARLKNRTVVQKVEDTAVELTSGLIRGLVAGVDLSASLVQGVYRMFVDLGKSTFQLATFKKLTPNRSFQAVGQMIKNLVSEKASDLQMARIKSSPYYPLMKVSKLSLGDKSAKLSAKEGLFLSNWVNLIWNHVVAPSIAMPISIGTRGDVRKAYNISKAINPYLSSQRAFDGYLNSIRASSFTDFAKYLENHGHNAEADPNVFKEAANVVNTTTATARLGEKDMDHKWLNVIMFAPRKVFSEVKLYTPWAFVHYAKMPKPVRMKALKDLAFFLSAFVSANAIVWAANRKDEEDDNFWNPNSSDFLTHRIGDKRISIAGGAKSMIVFQSRLFSGKFTDQYGKTTKLGDRFGKQINTRWDLITEFASGKAAPVVGILKKKLDERKGVETDDAEIIKNLSVPMWMQDLKEMYKNDPVAVNAIITVFSIFGANTRVVEPKKQSQGNTTTPGQTRNTTRETSRKND